jgi:putative sigma-54 modulation protein
MNLNISGHHIEMTDALHRYVSSKMERIERHFDHVLDAEVVLEVKKIRHTAEATMQVRGNRLHAEATNEDMYAAIDGMIDKLDRQVIRYKEKVSDHHDRSCRNLDKRTV